MVITNELVSTCIPCYLHHSPIFLMQKAGVGCLKILFSFMFLSLMTQASPTRDSAGLNRVPRLSYHPSPVEFVRFSLDRAGPMKWRVQACKVEYESKSTLFIHTLARWIRIPVWTKQGRGREEKILFPLPPFRPRTWQSCFVQTGLPI